MTNNEDSSRHEMAVAIGDGVVVIILIAAITMMAIWVTSEYSDVIETAARATTERLKKWLES